MRGRTARCLTDMVVPAGAKMFLEPGAAERGLLLLFLVSRQLCYVQFTSGSRHSQ